MKLHLLKSSLQDVAADTLVVFVSKQSKDGKGLKHLPDGVRQKLGSAVADEVFTGAALETVFFRDAHAGKSKHLMAVGLGELGALNHEVLRQAVGGAISQLKTMKQKSVAIAVDTVPKKVAGSERTTQALAEGATMGAYVFDTHKEKKKDAVQLQSISLVTSSSAKYYAKGMEIGQTIGESVNLARILGDQPGNMMTPSILAEEAAKAAKGTKLKVSAWDRARIVKEKMGSFLSVSLGSSEEPRFIVMEYRGAAASKAPICFVGKGLTFDSGGISIKPSGGMEEMKFDMCGGAAVIASMVAIARLGLKVNALGFVPSTENMSGPAALKPGDIVRARNGKTIEVNNTDAEGRLILADALVYASEQKPAWICDVATLTGAMVVALGNMHTGVFTRDDKMMQKVSKAAGASGEWIWRMPLTDFHVKDMRGTYADLSNISSGKGAGSATAAGFLEQFVDKSIPWAHFDVAGTAWNVGDRVPYSPKKGASGAMVRTFVEMALQHKA